MLNEVRRVLIPIVVTLFSIGKTLSQPVALDQTFGSNGIASMDFNGFGPQAGVSTVLLPDKKVLVAYQISSPGSRINFVIARLNENGSLDASFGVNGFFSQDLGPFNTVATPGTGKKIALQADGKIVCISTTYNPGSLFNEMLVLRLNSNGTLDNTFGNSGRSQIDIGDYSEMGVCILVQPDGKIVVGGASYNGGLPRLAVSRLLPNGQLDNSFDGDGKLILQLVTVFEIVYAMQQQVAADNPKAWRTSLNFGNEFSRQEN
jgi:uncharacterized delta-60 repeat protein